MRINDTLLCLNSKSRVAGTKGLSKFFRTNISNSETSRDRPIVLLWYRNQFYLVEKLHEVLSNHIKTHVWGNCLNSFDEECKLKTHQMFRLIISLCLMNSRRKTGFPTNRRTISYLCVLEFMLTLSIQKLGLNLRLIRLKELQKPIISIVRNQSFLVLTFSPDDSKC